MRVGSTRAARGQRFVARTVCALGSTVSSAPPSVRTVTAPAGVGAVVAGDTLTGAIDGLGQLQLAIVPAAA